MIFDYYFFFFSCDISFVLVHLARISGYWASSPIKQKKIVLSYSTFSFFGGIRHLVPAAVHRWRWLPASIFWWLSFFFLVWFHCVCWNNNRLLCSFWMTWLSVLSVESWLDANWILEVVWVFLCCCYRCCCSISRIIPLETMDSSLPAASLDDIF